LSQCNDKETDMPRESVKKRSKNVAAKAPRRTKKETVLALLRRKTGASIKELAAATGWQAHSVRGFLSGTVKKKLGLTLASKKLNDASRRYFVRGRS
jgi:uncharacterized protein DUF3489